MSRTDKTRPIRVVEADPHSRRFMYVTGEDYGYSFWKKMTSCHDSNCCGKVWMRKENNKRRHGWKRDLKHE